MHAAAQGKVQTLRMLLGIRGWNNREQSVLSSTKPEVSGWNPREPAVHPLTDETYKIKKTCVFPASVGPEGGAPEEGLTSYPLDLSVRSRELRPTNHKFWWKAGADAGSGRSLRKPEKAVELLLEEAYGKCDDNNGATDRLGSGHVLYLRMSYVVDVMVTGTYSDPMGSRLMDIAEVRQSRSFKRIGQKESWEDWDSYRWRKCEGPCCACTLALAEDKYRESTRALGRANGLAKGIRPGEYFEDAEVKFAQGLNDNHLFSRFAGELLQMYLDQEAVKRYCSDSHSLNVCKYDSDLNEAKSTTEDCDCPTCRRVKIWGGTRRIDSLLRSRARSKKTIRVVGRTHELFEVWELADNSMLSLSSEIVSQIFISALTQFTHGGKYVTNRRKEADRLSYIPLTLLSKLGPRPDEEVTTMTKSGDSKLAQQQPHPTGQTAARDQRSGLLDFTIQNKKGLTAFSLSTEYKDSYPALQRINGAIDCSRPMYKNVLPTVLEKIQYATLPLRYLQGVVLFFFDLATDLLVAATYWNDTRYGSSYAWACIVILIFHVVMQTLFDWFTSMKNHRPSDRNWNKFGQKVLMNVFHVRILQEAWSGLKKWRADNSKATPRTIPASFDQVKLIEGMFEGLPQAILQTYLAVQDINLGKAEDINNVRILSLFTSYMSFATSMGSMGMRIQPVWRGAFMFYVLTQVVMRSVTLTYFVFQVVESTNTIFTLNQAAGWYLWLYLATTWWMTVLFDFVNHKKGIGKSNLVPTWSGLFSCMFAFMVPVNLQEFTVLKTAMPKAAPLPFFVFRQLEMMAIGVWFVHNVYCESEPLPTTGLTSMDERDAIGWGGDCSLQTMESICTIPFDIDSADSKWQVELGHLEWSEEAYNTRLTNFCPCTLDGGDDTLRQCDGAEKQIEAEYREQQMLVAVNTSDGGEVTSDALDKERRGGKVSLLISNVFFFTLLNYLLVAVLPYEKSDRLHSGLRSLIWDNHGLIGCLRCFPCLSHLGESTGDVDVDERYEEKRKSRATTTAGDSFRDAKARASAVAQPGYGGASGTMTTRRVPARNSHGVRTGAGGMI
jgi:hypothetical protein